MSSPYIGEIRLFAGNFAPVGWQFCDGSLLPISENDTLFNLIGTTYGGDGQSTFAVPDLRSRVPIHQGTGFALAQAAGEETVTLTVNQIPSHTHAAGGNDTTTNSSTSPANNLWRNWQDNQFAAPPANTTMNVGAIAAAGGSQPHDNMLPFVAINYIISLFGIYPSPT